MHRFLFGALGAIVLLGAGCGPTLPTLSTEKITEKVAEQVQKSVTSAVERGAEEVAKQRTGKDIDLDVTGGGATFTDPESGRYLAVGEGVAIPEQFPEDVPVYENGIATSVSVEGDGKSASLLVLTKDSRDSIRAWFVSAASALGWEQEGTLDVGDQLILSFVRSDDAAGKLTVTIMPPNLQKEISVLTLRKGS